MLVVTWAYDDLKRPKNPDDLRLANVASSNCAQAGGLMKAESKSPSATAKDLPLLKMHLRVAFAWLA